ncbi:MAG: tRNA pseudouridine(55) synthase TruB [bacterium]|nr:tRNA pseudouridine(55) synthase TruB [bacterium]
MAWLNKHSGVLLFDKPSGVTSHDMVYRVRRILQQQEVGHTGTLDPMATGLLVMCVGRATKIAQFISNLEKCYLAEVKLGLSSATYDAEGLDPHAVPVETSHVTESEVLAVMNGFLGTQMQQVPAHSAVKINGQHLYELARNGQELELPEREVTITSLRLESFADATIRFEVCCSKGTYIRSLAHQIGQQLGCGAYLSALRRTSVGPFSVLDAVTPIHLAQLADEGKAGSALMPIDQVLQFGAICIQDSFRQQVGFGRMPAWTDVNRIEGVFEPGDRVVIKSMAGEVLAVGIAGSSSNEFTKHGGQPVSSYVRVLA